VCSVNNHTALSQEVICVFEGNLEVGKTVPVNGIWKSPHSGLYFFREHVAEM